MSELALNITGAELSSRSEWFEIKKELIAEGEVFELIESPIGFKAATSLQSQIKKHIKALEVHRMDITRPIDALKKQFMDQEKEFVQELDETLDKVLKVTNEYATKVRQEEEKEEKRRQEAERERIQKELAEQQEKDEKFKELFGDNATTEQPAPIVVSSPAFKPSKLKASADAKMVDVWFFEVIDLKKIPREFLKLDETLVRVFMQREKKANREPKLDGFAFTKKTKVQSR